VLISKEYKEALNTLSMCIVVCKFIQEGDFEIVYLNKKALDLAKLKEKEIIGKRLSELFSSNKKESLLESYMRVYESGVEESVEVECPLDHEHIALRKHRLSKYQDKYVVNVYDGEDELESAKEKSKKLFEQSRLAQMGEMISMIAHQWRQPLGAIASTTINLQMKLELEVFDLANQDEREGCTDYFAKRLENISSYVKNLTTTIDDFRNFYEPNKEKSMVSLKTILRKSLNVIHTSLVNDNIEMVIKCENEEKIAVFDRELLQVVLNILKNAQDNFKEKRVQDAKIVIECFKNKIKISDNGGGIEQEIIDKIFDPYFSTKNKKNGTGLGLYMSKIIVEEHHKGELNVFNVNDGVCFEIKL
jgi:signal transduction histidine kinase